MTEFSKEMRDKLRMEKKLGYKPISVVKHGLQEQFFKELKEKEAEFLKAKKPFCAKCAIIDFTLEWDKQIKELEHSTGWARAEEIDLKEINLDDYANPKRWKTIKTSEILKPANFAKGEKATMIYFKDFRCNRGHNLSIEMPEVVKEENQLEKPKRS